MWRIIIFLLVSPIEGSGRVAYFPELQDKLPQPHVDSLTRESVPLLQPQEFDKTPTVGNEHQPPKWARSHLIIDSVRGNWTQFDAYDCTRPKMVHPVYIEALERCPVSNEALETWKKEFLVVQKRKHVRIIMWKCHLTRNEIGAYCGAADHQTLSLDQMSFDTNMPITEDDCRKMVRDHEYCVPQFKCLPFTMKRNVGKTSVKYHRAGKSYYTAYDLSCHGGAVLGSQGKIRNNFVLYTHDTIEIRREEFELQEDGYLRNPITQYALNDKCKLQDGTCQDNGWTYVWTYTELQDECQGIATKVTRGVVHYPKDTQEDRKVFIATDGSLSSFVVGPITELCGYPAYSTDFDNIFLASPILKTKFQNITQADIKLNLDLSIKLAYSHNKLLNYTQQIYRTVMLEQCLRQQRRVENYPTLAATQLAFNAGQTVSLTPGAFATGVGEIVYRYYCKHHVVQALMGHDRCYNALPISVPSHVAGNFHHLIERERQISGNKSDDHPTFWLEPHSHRIIVNAVEKPCTRMAAHYKNVNNEFVSVQPHLVLPSHQPVGIRPRTSLIPGVGEENWNGGGVYTDAQLQSFVAATYDSSIRLNVQTRLVDEIRGQNPESETLPLTAISRIFGIGSAAANILSALFNWLPYIIFFLACAFSYSWTQNLCSCGYRFRLLRGNVTRFSNFSVLSALCCPHQMTQHATPGRFRPPPIFSYKSFKQNLFKQHASTEPRMETNRPSLWERTKESAFRKMGFQPIPVTPAPPYPSSNNTEQPFSLQPVYPSLPTVPVHSPPTTSYKQKRARVDEPVLRETRPGDDVHTSDSIV